MNGINGVTHINGIQQFGVGEIPKIAAVDFDGVVCEYEKWDGNPANIGKPIVGSLTAIKRLVLSGYKVVIFSARARHPEGKIAIEDFLSKWGYAKFVVEVTCIKPPYTVLFDDRARHVPQNKPNGLKTAVKGYIEKTGEYLRP